MQKIVIEIVTQFFRTSSTRSEKFKILTEIDKNKIIIERTRLFLFSGSGWSL